MRAKAQQTKWFTATPAAPPTSRAYTTEKDWEEHKDRILELHEKKVQLPEIIATLKREKGFEASPSQYKSRLKQWGMRRHFTLQERRKIIHEIQKRGGRIPIFKNLKGKTIENEKISSVWNRRGREGVVSNNQTLNHDECGIIAITPPPSSPATPAPIRPLSPRSPDLSSCMVTMDWVPEWKLTLSVGSRSPCESSTSLVRSSRSCTPMSESIDHCASPSIWELLLLEEIADRWMKHLGLSIDFEFEPLNTEGGWIARYEIFPAPTPNAIINCESGSIREIEEDGVQDVHSIDDHFSFSSTAGDEIQGSGVDSEGSGAIGEFISDATIQEIIGKASDTEGDPDVTVSQSDDESDISGDFPATDDESDTESYPDDLWYDDAFDDEQPDIDGDIYRTFLFSDDAYSEDLWTLYLDYEELLDRQERSLAGVVELLFCSQLVSLTSDEREIIRGMRRELVAALRFHWAYETSEAMECVSRIAEYFENVFGCEGFATRLLYLDMADMYKTLGSLDKALMHKSLMLLIKVRLLVVDEKVVEHFHCGEYFRYRGSGDAIYWRRKLLAAELFALQGQVQRAKDTILPLFQSGAGIPVPASRRNLRLLEKVLRKLGQYEQALGISHLMLIRARAQELEEGRTDHAMFQVSFEMAAHLTERAWPSTLPMLDDSESLERRLTQDLRDFDSMNTGSSIRIFSIVYWLADSNHANKNFSKAIEYYDRSLHLLEMIFPDWKYHKYTVDVLSGLVGLLSERGMVMYAKPLSHYVVKCWNRAYGPFDANVIKAIQAANPIAKGGRELKTIEI